MLTPAISFFMIEFPVVVVIFFEFVFFLTVPMIVIMILGVSAKVFIFLIGQLAF